LIGKKAYKFKKTSWTFILEFSIKYRDGGEYLNVASIQNGDIIKTYKELCSLLEIKQCDGNSKKAQIKKMKELFSFEKKGRSFIIKEVYGEKHSSLSSGHLANGIQKILLTKLIENKTNIITMKYTELIDWLGIINSSYMENKNNKSTYIEETNCSKFELDRFYIDTWATLRSSAIYSIDDLNKKNLIVKKNMITICFKGTKKNKIRVVSDEEYAKIKDIEREVLSNHGIKNMAVAHMSGRHREIMPEVMGKINETFVTDNILYYYPVVRLALNRRLVDDNYRYENIDQFQIEVNNKLIDKFNSHFIATNNKAIDELEFNACALNMYDKDKFENIAADTYVGNIKGLINKLIKINSP
jgi:hypothetical protein